MSVQACCGGRTELCTNSGDGDVLGELWWAARNDA